MRNPNAPGKGDSRLTQEEEGRYSTGAHDSQTNVDLTATPAERVVAAKPGTYSLLHIRCIAEDGLVLNPTYAHPNLVVDPQGRVAKVYEDPGIRGFRIVTARGWKAVCEVRQHGARCYFWNSHTSQAQWEAPNSTMAPPDP